MTRIKKFNSCGWSRWDLKRNDFVSYVSVKLCKKIWVFKLIRIQSRSLRERNSLLFGPFIRGRKSSWSLNFVWFFHFAYYDWSTHKSEQRNLLLILYIWERKSHINLMIYYSKLYNYEFENKKKERETERKG